MQSSETPVQTPSIMKPIIIIAAVAVLLTVMHLSASFLVPLMLGIFFAILLTPINRWLKKKRIPAGIALLLSAGVFALVALLLLILIGGSLSVLASSLSEYETLFAERQAELASTAESLDSSGSIKTLTTALNPTQLVDTLKYLLSSVMGILQQGVLILFITLFFLAEAPRFKKRMVTAFGADHFFTRNTTAMVHMTISYFGLRVIVNLIVATATGIMLWFFGIPYAGLWTVLIFFLSFVPYIGAIIAMIPPVLLAYAEGGLGLALVIIVLSLIINGLSENIVSPMVMGKGLSISPTVTFLAFIFWMFILGGSGAFVAMPLTVMLILFMNSFEETRGLAAMMRNSPDQE